METEYTPLPWPRPFTSALNKREALLVLLYLPIHAVALQWLLTGFVERGTLTPGSANLVYYAVGFGYMVCEHCYQQEHDMTRLLTPKVEAEE